MVHEEPLDTGVGTVGCNKTVPLKDPPCICIDNEDRLAACIQKNTVSRFFTYTVYG